MGVLVASAHRTACREAQALSSCEAEQDLDRGASCSLQKELLLQAGMVWPSGAVSGRLARAVLPDGLIVVMRTPTAREL